MVQGLPAIDWKNPVNNAKLFKLVLDQIKAPNTKLIAAGFGPDIPQSAISYRLNSLKQGNTPMPVVTSTPAKTNGAMRTAKRAAPTSKQQSTKRRGSKGGKMLSNNSGDDTDTAMDSEEEQSAAETINEKTPTAPSHPAKRDKTLGGRITKRSSPRKSKETNYKNLEDPFVSMENAKDENGINIFGEPSGTESEDPYASDGSFKNMEKGDGIKMEDAV